MITGKMVIESECQFHIVFHQGRWMVSVDIVVGVGGDPQLKKSVNVPFAITDRTKMTVQELCAEACRRVAEIEKSEIVFCHPDAPEVSVPVPVTPPLAAELKPAAVAEAPIPTALSKPPWWKFWNKKP